jgi:hypothetical protein
MDKVVKEYKSFANGEQGGIINRTRCGSLKNDIKHSTDVCAATMPLLIKPHLNPSTLRSQFSPEPSLPPLGWSQRTTFDSESSSLPRPHPIPFVAEDQSSPSQAASRNDNSNRNRYIPKPKGEFNRPSNGYCLEAMCKDVLNWDSDRWSQVEVSGLQSSILTNLISLAAALCWDTGR